MDEEFKKDEILIEQRKLNIPKDLRNIAVQQDNNSEVIYFIVPRYINENDLSNNSFLLKTLSRGGRNDVLFSSKDIEVLKDTVRIKWVIDEFSTSYCGELQIQLIVFNENFKWQTEIAKVNILKTIDDANLATSKVGLIEDLILQFNEKVEVIENNTEEIKEIKNEIYETIEDTERLLENATDIKNEVDRIKEEAEHYASFSQQSADLAQKIKDSTEIFYDVDKELNRVGFKRANEKTFTYTGNLKGVKGDKGEEIELQKTPTHIQWKYKDSESWTNLIAIDDLKGEDGVGEKGNGWLLGEGIPVNSVGMDGDFYIQTSTYDIFNKEEGVWISIGNIKGEQGLAGIDGTNGREVELQKGETHIQWKYVDTEEWENLIEISMLKGERGETGLQGERGQDGREIELRRHDTHVQYKYKGELDTAWRNVIALEYIKGDKGEIGENGKSVELQKTVTHIEWRQEEGSWEELVPLSELKGEKGDSADVSQFYTKGEVDEKNFEIETEIKKINSNLKNIKIYLSLEELGQEIGYETVQKCIDSMENFSIAFISINSSNNQSEYPISSGMLKIIKTGEASVETFFSSPTKDRLFYGKMINQTFEKWIELLNNEVMEASPFPYSDGWGDFDSRVNISRLYKINNQVYLSLQAKCTSQINAGSFKYIFTLPEGYRPKNDIFVPAGARSGGSQKFAQLVIKANGNVEIQPTEVCQAGQFVNGVVTYFTY